MMYDIIVFENLGFRPSTRKRESGVFKNLHSEDRFRKPTFFGVRKGRSYVKAKMEGKNLRFQYENTGYAWNVPKTLRGLTSKTTTLLVQHTFPYEMVRKVIFIMYGYCSLRGQSG